MVHEIDTDRVVLAGQKGHPELRANPIRTRDQNRLTISRHVEPEEPSKGTDLRQDPLGKRAPRELPDAADHLVARIDVDA